MIPRSFKISLLASALIHAGGVAGFSYKAVTDAVLSHPPAMVTAKNEPRTVRFELIDTPASARTNEPARDATLMSDKNTRAQDTFRGDKKLPDSPHLDGKTTESKDTRPRMPARQARPQSVKGIPTEQKPLTKPSPEKEPVVRTQPQQPEAAAQKEEEIIRVAKNTSPRGDAAQTASPLVPPPTAATTVSANNTSADAEITGELSFATTRHFFGEYLLKMKHAVERQWVSRLVSQYSGLVNSRAVIDFQIQPDGRVTDLAIRSTEGDSYFALVCVSSIDGAQPFDKIPYDEIPGLPDELKNKPISIRFTFRYN